MNTVAWSVLIIVAAVVAMVLHDRGLSNTMDTIGIRLIEASDRRRKRQREQEEALRARRKKAVAAEAEDKRPTPAVSSGDVLQHFRQDDGACVGESALSSWKIGTEEIEKLAHGETIWSGDGDSPATGLALHCTICRKKVDACDCTIWCLACSSYHHRRNSTCVASNISNLKASRPVS